MDYRHGSHTKYKIEYHFVWVTKYRYQVLSGDIGLRVREFVRQTCERLEVEILRGVVSKDHVYLLVSAPPNLSPSEVMRRVKGRSSTKLFEEFPHLKKRYWGKHFWARGYFCVTAGELTKEMIKAYLAHHFERNPNDHFDVKYSMRPLHDQLTEGYRSTTAILKINMGSFHKTLPLLYRASAYTGH